MCECVCECVCGVWCVCVSVSVCVRARARSKMLTLLPMATRFVLKHLKFTTPRSCKESSSPTHDKFEEIIAKQNLVHVTGGGGGQAFHTPLDRLHCAIRFTKLLTVQFSAVPCYHPRTGANIASALLRDMQ